MESLILLRPGETGSVVRFVVVPASACSVEAVRIDEIGEIL